MTIIEERTMTDIQRMSKSVERMDEIGRDVKRIADAMEALVEVLKSK